MKNDEEKRRLLANFATRHSGEVTLVSVKVADAIAEMLAENEKLVAVHDALCSVVASVYEPYRKVTSAKVASSAWRTRRELRRQMGNLFDVDLCESILHALGVEFFETRKQNER